MNEAERLRLTELAAALRRLAQPTGPMHPWWDRISDMEALCRGERTIVKMTVTEWIKEAESLLGAVQ